MEAYELDLDQSPPSPTSWDWGQRWKQDLITKVEKMPMRDFLQQMRSTWQMRRLRLRELESPAHILGAVCCGRAHFEFESVRCQGGSVLLLPVSLFNSADRVPEGAELPGEGLADSRQAKVLTGASEGGGGASSAKTKQRAVTESARAKGCGWSAWHLKEATPTLQSRGCRCLQAARLGQRFRIRGSELSEGPRGNYLAPGHRAGLGLRSPRLPAGRPAEQRPEVVQAIY